MKKQILQLVLVAMLTPMLIQAQTSRDTTAAIKGVQQRAISQKDIRVYDDFIVKNNIKDSSYLAYINASRAYSLYQIHEQKIENNQDKPQEYAYPKSEVDSILSYFAKAIDYCEKCRVRYQYDRYKFMTDNKIPENTLISSDLIALRAAGYKPDRTGKGISIGYMQGKNAWVGLEVSFLKFVQPRYKLQRTKSDGSKSTVKSHKRVGVSVFPLAYYYNPHERIGEFSLSFFQLDAPVFINITRFGFQRIDDKARSFYRPEIGFAQGLFSVSYAYNVMFDKAIRGQAEKHLFNFRCNFLLASKERD